MIRFVRIDNIKHNRHSWAGNHIGKTFWVVKCYHSPYGGNEVWWRLLHKFRDEHSPAGTHRGYIPESSFEFIKTMEPPKYIKKHEIR